MDVAEKIFEQIAVVEYSDDEGSYQSVHKNVVAQLANGSEANVLDVLTDVLNFWEKHLFANGFLPDAREFKSDTTIRFRTRAECEASRLDFEVVRGQRFKQRLQFFKFNASAGVAEPVDFTGGDVKFTIRRPTLVVDIAGKHAATGRIHKTSVTLTADESEALSKLATDEDRGKFILSLPSAQAALQNLAKEGDAQVT